jgi:glycosyltransferase involved in cell wall biosynthesis
MRTLIIDGQLWQTNAWYRGMGVYTRGLLSTYIKDNEGPYIIILNKNIYTPIERIHEIERAFPDVVIKFLRLPTNGLEDERAVAILDKFILKQDLAGDKFVYIVLSLFMFDFCANFPSSGTKILLHYDLIPLIYWEYFEKLFPPQLYFHRFKRFFEADIVLTISETTASDTVSRLGLSKDRVVVIDGAAENIKNDSEANQTSDISEKFNLSKQKYILMPSGGYPHKNALRAVEAFANIVEDTAQGIKLVATSFYDDDERRELELLCKDIIFTGNISSADLVELYRGCQALLMPSLYEGLGIPVLEGVLYDKPVVCSDISVFREIPHFNEAFYVFDPYDIDSIYDCLLEALAKVDFETKKKYYDSIIKKYNWERTVEVFGKILREVKPRRKIQQTKIAVICPDPRLENKVGHIAQELWGYSKEQNIEIVYFIDSGGASPGSSNYNADYIRYIATNYDIKDFYDVHNIEKFDRVLYLITDEARFSNSLLAALTVPGFVYICCNDYRQSIERLGNENLISTSQFESEKFIINSLDDNTCNAISLIGGAKGLIIEEESLKAVKNAIKLTSQNGPVVTVSLLKDNSTTEINHKQTDFDTILKLLEHVENRNIK